MSESRVRWQNEEEYMNRFLRILPVAFALISISALADSSNLNVNFGIDANSGIGDNIGGRIFGPGVNLLVGGGTGSGWFDGVPMYTPGSIGGGGTTIFFDYAAGTVGSQTVDYSDSEIFATGFDAGSFVFPTTGQDFTVTLAASIEPITIVICPNNACQYLLIGTKPGTLTLSFDYSSYAGAYYAGIGSFTTTPEPGTLGLMAIGLGIIAWLGRRQWDSRQSV